MSQYEKWYTNFRRVISNSIFEGQKFCRETVASLRPLSLGGGTQRARGQGLVEYALILVLVAVVVIAALTVLGEELNDVYERISCTMGGNTWRTDSGNQNSGRCVTRASRNGGWHAGTTDRLIARAMPGSDNLQAAYSFVLAT